jgi:glycosyltransferase involved in cell wall biosynthesis
MDKVIICGCVRNCEKYIDRVFATITQIETLFSETRIIIAYDESTDKSLLKLSQHKRLRGNKMDVLINRNPLYPYRTQNIANARNSILQKMREVDGNGQFPVFIMMDFDDVCAAPLDLAVLKRALNRESEWDSISFNRPGYYDIWAVSLKPFIYSSWGWTEPREVVKIMREYIVDKLAKLDPGQLLECSSAFNGFAIYKSSVFLKCGYDWRRPLEYMTLEDVEKNREALGSSSRSIRYPLDKSVEEPDCEHRSFHMSALHRFGARIRISPEILFSHEILGHA